MQSIQSISAGGVLIQDGKVLLVQANYGANKGLLMLPGGMLETGESLEEAVAREVLEETGLSIRPLGIIGIRCGVQERNDRLETGLYVIYVVEAISGTLQPVDENEISNLVFFPIVQALSDPNVIDLTKELIRAACSRNGPLIKQSRTFSTTANYKTYDVYTK